MKKIEDIDTVGEHARLYQAGLYVWKAYELQKKPFEAKKAELLYREAIRLAPNHPDFKHNLATLLAKDSHKFTEAESLLKEIKQLDPHNPWWVTSLADFYHHKLQDFRLARKYYQEALEIMKANPQRPNWLTKEKIEGRLASIS